MVQLECREDGSATAPVATPEQARRLRSSRKMRFGRPEQSARKEFWNQFW